MDQDMFRDSYITNYDELNDDGSDLEVKGLAASATGCQA